MPPIKKPTFPIPSLERVSFQPFQHRLWIGVCSIDCSNMQLQHCIARAVEKFPGTFVSEDGQVLPKPNVYGILGNRRWLSVYKKAYHGRQAHKTRSLARLQVLALYFALEKPLVYRHFSE